jgi:hypothetical protein
LIEGYTLPTAQAARAEDQERHIMSKGQPLESEPLTKHPNSEHHNHVVRGKFVVLCPDVANSSAGLTRGKDVRGGDPEMLFLDFETTMVRGGLLAGLRA